MERRCFVRAWELIAALCFGLGLYLTLRLPTTGLDLAFHDDAEILYHTLVVLKGHALYRDSVSHHFLGYVVPFVAAAKLVGFSELLVRQVAVVTQTLVAVGIFLCARTIAIPFATALLVLALTLAAREPFTVAFYLQYLCNVPLVWILWRSLCAVKRSSAAPLSWAFLLCGIGLTFDQRMAFAFLIPTAALMLCGERRTARVLKIAAPAAIAPLLALLYLTTQGAWDDFVRQTISYPLHQRVGSQSAYDIAREGVLLHRYLFTETPILAVLAVIGWGAAVRSGIRERATPEGRVHLLLCWVALPLAAIAFVGSRDWPYYTIVWLPYLALLAPLGARWFGTELLRRAYLMSCWLPVALSLASVASNLNERHGAPYPRDGARDVARFLETRMKEDDTLFVWGYRLDIYVYLRRLAFDPFGNQMLIHPDRSVVGDDARRRHVEPYYEARFLEDLASRPPTFLVIYQGSEGERSEASDAVLRAAKEHYDRVFSNEARDVFGLNNRFEVFERRETPAPGAER